MSTAETKPTGIDPQDLADHEAVMRHVIDGTPWSRNSPGASASGRRNSWRNPPPTCEIDVDALIMPPVTTHEVCARFRRGIALGLAGPHDDKAAAPHGFRISPRTIARSLIGEPARPNAMHAGIEHIPHASSRAAWIRASTSISPMLAAGFLHEFLRPLADAPGEFRLHGVAVDHMPHDGLVVRRGLAGSIPWVWFLRCS